MALRAICKFIDWAVQARMVYSCCFLAFDFCLSSIICSESVDLKNTAFVLIHQPIIY